MYRLAIILSHPIQYYSPLFQLLEQRDAVQFKVFYTAYKTRNSFDSEFGHEVTWDIPLMEGYEYESLKNTAKSPGSHHFFGAINPEIITRIKTYRPDVILVVGWSFFSHLQVMRYFNGKIPILFRGDSHLLDEKPGIKKVLRRLLLRWVYRHVDAALYVGEHNKDYYRMHGIVEHQLYYGPHAIDNKRFEQCKANEVHTWKKKFGIKDERIVLFVGKWSLKKDPLALMEVAERWRQNKAIRFVFMGSGPLEEAMKLRAKEFPNVILHGFQNQSAMPMVYQLADVMVLPSAGPGETWGLAVNESLAAGTPVVVSNKVGCAPDLVDEGLQGITYSQGDTDALEASIQKQLLRVEKYGRAQLKKVCQEKVASHSFSQLARSIEKAVRHLNTSGQ